MLQRLRGRGDGDGCAVHGHGSGVGLVDAVEEARELGAAGAEEPGEAHDLAAAELDVGRVERALPADAGGPVHGLARGDLARGALAVEGAEGLQVLADHLGDEPGPVDVAREVLAHEPAVAEHREAVADREDLVEEVGDEEDGDALVAEAAHHAEEALDLVGVEAGGRLVEDQDLRVEHGRPADRHELLQREADGGERRARIQVAEPHARQHLGGGGVRALPIDAEAAAPLVAEHDVLADGEVPAEVDLLVDRGDPRGLRVGGAGEAALGAVDDDASGVDPVDARERRDQRRLPGAVLAHERVDLAGEEPEVHPVERLDAREGDGDAPHLDDGAGCLHARAPFLRRRRRLAGGGGGANDPPRLPVWPCGRVRTSGRAARWRPSRRSRTRRTGRRSTTRRSRRRAASARPRARCRRTAGCTRRRS